MGPAGIAAITVLAAIVFAAVGAAMGPFGDLPALIGYVMAACILVGGGLEIAAVQAARPRPNRRVCRCR